MRQTVSRPVRLGVGPPFGAHDQILRSHMYLLLHAGRGGSPTRLHTGLHTEVGFGLMRKSRHYMFVAKGIHSAPTQELISHLLFQTSWLQTQRSRVRFPALPDFLSSSGSGAGSIQPLCG
jgi:hypothetical protein